MRLQFNASRAREVFGILQRLWQEKAGIFENIVLPQDRVVLPEDPTAVANFFVFTAITQRGGIVSEDPFKYLVALRDRYPDLFNPLTVFREWTPKQIEKALVEIIVERAYKNGTNGELKKLEEQLILFGVPEQVIKKILYKVDEFAMSWWRNARTLTERWNGNILAAYDGVNNFEEFFARVDYRSKKNPLGLHGMRRKILSLLTIWLQEKGLVPVFPTPIPVDFHAMRLLFATGVVEAIGIEPFVVKPKNHPSNFVGRHFVRVTEGLMDEIALWSLKFLSENGFSHLAINPALWVLSRELCPHEFQNQSRGRKVRMRLVFSEALEKHPGLWPHPYSDPAHHCPLAGVCSKIIPWGPYYDWGILALDKRIPYPHEPLFDSLQLVPGRKRNGRA